MSCGSNVRDDSTLLYLSSEDTTVLSTIVSSTSISVFFSSIWAASSAGPYAINAFTAAAVRAFPWTLAHTAPPVTLSMNIAPKKTSPLRKTISKRHPNTITVFCHGLCEELIIFLYSSVLLYRSLTISHISFRITVTIIP